MASGNEPKPSDKITSKPPDSLASALPSYPTGFQARPPAPPPPEPAVPSTPESIPLPPTPAIEPAKKMTVEELGQLMERLDGFMPAFLVALAFLTACFAIRNSDFLMHLATGRFLAQSIGEGKIGNLFGAEPFSHTTAGVYWVNHSWLYDLLLYGLFLLMGAVGLVLLKSALTGFLAWVLLQIRRPNQSIWAPAACAGLAILALSPQLVYRPAVVSFLFLGLTLWLLTKPGAAPEKKGKKVLVPPRRHLWYLVPLFILWVNMDGWFLLGPLTVGLYLLGDVLQESLGPDRKGDDTPPQDERRLLISVLVLSLLACAINPHHVRAFMLPPYLPLGGASSALQNDSFFKLAYYSPFQSEYFGDKAQGLNVAGIAYYVLALLGVVSFVLNGGPNTSAEQSGWRWWRGLIWGTFLLLSAYHARAVPFFAVVAGPITALNLQDFATRVYGTQPRVTEAWKNWSIGGRVATLIAGVALLVLCWPGWLQGAPHENRRVSWGLIVDPSLEKLSGSMEEQRQTWGLNDREFGLNLRPDVANYFAWFCQEKGFFDHRTQPFKNAANDYVDLRGYLIPDSEEVEETSRRRQQAIARGTSFSRRTDLPWQKVFRERGIRYVVLYGVPERTVRWMLADQDQWTPLYLDGRTVVMGWTDPDRAAAEARGSKPFPAEARFDVQRRAFGPNAEKTPGRRPDRGPQAQNREWWENYLFASNPSPLRSHEANMLLQYHGWHTPYETNRLYRDWQFIFAAGLVGMGAPQGDHVALQTSLAYRRLLADVYYESQTKQAGRRSRSPWVDQEAWDWFQAFLLNHDEGPSGAIWLAVRAARHALVENPDDAAAYSRLLQAYSSLQQLTRERTWLGRMPLLQVIRRYQVVYCLKQVLLIEPDNGNAHAELARLYDGMQFFDVALKHYEKAIEHLKGVETGNAEADELLKNRLEGLEKRRDQLSEGVSKELDRYEVGSVQDKTVFDKAMRARSQGLYQQALDVLQPELDKLPPDGIVFVLETNLAMGEIDHVREALKDEFRGKLRIQVARYALPAYEWFQVVLAAVSGDYPQAEEFLKKLEESASGDPNKPEDNLAAVVELLKLRIDPRPKEPAPMVGPLLFLPGPLRMPVAPPLAFLALSHLQRIEALNVAAQFEDDRIARTVIRTDLRALRGLLALEHGDTALAMRHFEQCLQLDPHSHYPSQAAAAHYLRLLRENHEPPGAKRE